MIDSYYSQILRTLPIYHVTIISYQLLYLVWILISLHHSFHYFDSLLFITIIAMYTNHFAKWLEILQWIICGGNNTYILNQLITVYDFESLFHLNLFERIMMSTISSIRNKWFMWHIWIYSKIMYLCDILEG